MTDETALYVRVRGEVVRVDGRSAVVGRSRTCDVQLDVQGVSRRHCEVLLREDGASVRDLGSTHGTYLDGRRIETEERVRAGVLVRLGSHGPHFEIVNAIVHGRPVLGPSDATIVRPAAAASTASAASAAPARGRGRFAAGLAWGLVAGIVVGVAALALFDLRF